MGVTSSILNRSIAPGNTSLRNEVISDASSRWRMSGRGAGTRRLERGVRGREARDRHPIRRARHVVEAHLVAEVHRPRFAAVFAADAELDVAARRASLLDTHAHELAHALDIDRVE